MAQIAFTRSTVPAVSDWISVGIRIYLDTQKRHKNASKIEKIKKKNKKEPIAKIFIRGKYRSKSTCRHICDRVKDYFRRLENKNQIKYLVFSFNNSIFDRSVVALRFTGQGTTTVPANKSNHSFYLNGSKILAMLGAVFNPNKFFFKMKPLLSLIAICLFLFASLPAKTYAQEWTRHYDPWAGDIGSMLHSFFGTSAKCNGCKTTVRDIPGSKDSVTMTIRCKDGSEWSDVVPGYKGSGATVCDKDIGGGEGGGTGKEDKHQ